MGTSMRLTARLCWSLDARPWLVLVADATGAVLFLLGCVAFYFPSHHIGGVTLFLIGSILMVLSTLARVLLRYGPSE